MEPHYRVGDFSFTLELRGECLNCIANEDRWFPLAALAWRRKAGLPASADVEKRLLAVRKRGNA